MVVRLNLKQKLLLTLSIISFVVLLVSFLNYKMLKSEQKNMSLFSHWSDIDMIMNEEVLAKFAKLRTDFLYWKDNPSDANWKQVEMSFKEAEEGLNTWGKMISNESQLSKIALEWKDLLEELKKTILSCKELHHEREKNIEKIWNYEQRLKVLLEDTMENTIHPAKEKALHSGNIKLFAFMSDIDMIMNEDIIEPFLDFELSLYSYILGKRSSEDVDKNFVILKDGFDKWSKLIKGYPDFEKAATNISNLLNEVNQLWPKIKNNTEKLDNLTSLVMSKVTYLNKKADSLMEEVVNSKRSNVFLKMMDNAKKNLEFSLIEVGIVLGLIVLVGLGTRQACKPLMALIDRLKDLAVGETDLNKQLEVKAINCSQITKCNNPDCPIYGKESHCWYEAGSYAPIVYCPKIKEGIYSSCEECKVYKQAINTEIDEVSTFVNAFIKRIRELIINIKAKGTTVALESQNLSSIAEQLANGAVDSQLQAEEVNKVSETTAESVSAVARAMEQMTATVKEIAEHTTQASQIAQQASDEALHAQNVIKNLAVASERISEVSKIIGSIAERTKLLALNATIEAARAGEAGKGFSVVANEVKELAQQTGSSVTEIEEMLHDLKQGVAEALKAMDKIGEVIQKVAELSNNIAIAVEEQTATTNEVSDNTQKVSKEVNEMAKMSEAISTAGNQTAQGAENIKNTAYKLRELSNDLQKLLEEFKT